MSKTFTDIKDLAVIPVPNATPTYCPVSQGDLWERVTDTVQNYGYVMEWQTHQMHRKNPWFISKMRVISHRLPSDREMGWEIGVINSYDQSRAIRLLFGSTVFACTNGCIFADHILKTKHTAKVWDRLPYLITRTIDMFEVEVGKAAHFYERLKEVPFRRPDVSEFAVRLAQSNLLPRTKVVDLVEESMTPSFEYETRERPVLWNVHNAYTHLCKEVSPVEAPRRIMGMERMMRDHYALA